MARKRSLESLLKALRQQLPLLTERYGVETLEVFGSYVRDEQKGDSDLISRSRFERRQFSSR